MPTIIISADYIGGAIKSAKHHNNISVTRLAHLFGCEVKQLHRYTSGTDLIPRDVLRRIFTYAAMMDAALAQN